jgi:hypothetical protein
LKASEIESMSEQDRNQHFDHWAALAEQLGLPPAATPSPEAPAAVARKPAPVFEESARAVAPPPPPEPLPPAEKPAGPEPFRAQGSRRPPRPAEFERAIEHRDPAPVPKEIEEPAGQGEAGEEIEKPRSSGRRRGRRPDKEKGGMPSAVEEASEGPAEGDAAVHEKAEPTERRGRGRGRSGTKPARSSRPVPEAGPAPADESAPGQAVEPEEKEEELDTLSDWNVPSWNELIASLYRPER